MGTIHVLPKEIANMIAAGEVVERPASAAKELVENSIDAGASEITVEIRGGGAAFLRVTDNGCGIPYADAPTAFLRHATSKVATARDLEAISTLGFRGEALAAIAAVSRVEMLTRTPEARVGCAITLENGKVLEQGEAGCPQGTTVTVRSLFANVPARYKYLKKDAAEGAAVQGVVQREALGHPEIAFRFVRDNRPVFFTSGDGNLENAIFATLGAEFGGELLPVAGGQEGVEVSGFVTRPTAGRGSRGSQYFFVNGRWIKSALLSAALENAYKNQLLVGRFPGGVLRLTLSPGALDVNSHPTKTEVRFAGEKRVYDALYRAVRAALGEGEDRPTLTLESPAQPPRSAAGTSIPVEPWPGFGPGASKPPAPAEPPEPPESAPTGAQAPGDEWTAPVGDPVPAGTTPGGRGAEEETLVFSSPVMERVRAARLQEPWAVTRPPQPEVPRPPQPEPPRPAQPEAPQATRAEDPQPVQVGQTALAEPPARDWRVVGEALRTYIIVEQGDKLLFIDKHAAHERMGFDALKEQGYRPMAQELLSPMAVTLPAQEAQALAEHAAELEQFGFGVEEFGLDTLLVRRAPDYLALGGIPAALGELARQYLAGGGPDPEEQRDALMHTMACKGAIKGGQRNAPEELERVAQAVLSGQVTHCPHGRPVAMEVTRAQLERGFKRT